MASAPTAVMGQVHRISAAALTSIDRHSITKLDTSDRVLAKTANLITPKPTNVSDTLWAAASKVGWGRKNKANAVDSLLTLLLVLFCPVWMYINWATLEYYDGSLTAFVSSFSLYPNTLLFARDFPKPSLNATLGYLGWVLFQALLYKFLPGRVCEGQRTPGGHLLKYCTNGLLAWAISHYCVFLLSSFGILDLAFIAKNWQGLLFTANVYGFVLAGVAQWKGYTDPTYPEDRKMTGSWVFDFFSGVELNPRLGKTFDLKFFHNGRPGIVAWTLIDISWAAYQFQQFGYVSVSMWIVLVLHTMYVVDFFYNEDWYTRTIDISHDHFGFMLTWGDSTFLPAFYTLQAQYLARYPTALSGPQAALVLGIGLLGYTIFRVSNSERDRVRSSNGNCTVWGKPAEVIRCTYQTNDGKKHESLLSKSGWWGFSRHANYLADLLQSFAMCAACGTTNILPYSYFVFMTILLCHRAIRDEQRCRNKYGAKWEEYCRAVPYRILPYVW